ncbi:restriction endonuclease subunit S [Spirulina subsalsa]|uniref:restriction endonuclease subunit S n=1 Tax=Spirulina subsalsa TaxID=54311 RepID=UPI0002FFE0C8|nr:restriction endonuclease subunit S [Spirulina subsalsa]
MSEWKETKISDIADFNVNSINKDFKFNFIEYIDTSSVEKGRLLNTQKLKLKEAPSRAKRRVQKNDILISSVRPNLEHYYFIKKCSKNTIVSTGFVVITPKEITDPYFLYCLLTSQKYTQYLTSIANSHTSTYPSFNPDIISDSILPIPGIQEQKRIAAVLSCLDDKIENLRKQNETLEKIAQTLFKHWFIDFEFPNENGQPYRSSGGAMQPSELGAIPAGWRVGKLGDVVDVFTGFPFKSDLYSFDSGIRVVRGENVSLGFLRWDTEKRWNHDIDSYDNYFLQKNDYIIGMDGSRVGKNRTIIFESSLPLLLAQRVAGLRAKKSTFYQGYINILLMNKKFEKYVDFIKTGTSIPHISGKQIKDFECLVPCHDSLKKFQIF